MLLKRANWALKLQSYLKNIRIIHYCFLPTLDYSTSQQYKTLKPELYSSGYIFKTAYISASVI
jgi:hypothetical protein